MRIVRAVIGFSYGVCVLVAALMSAFVCGTVLALPFVVLPRGRRERYTIVAAELWARSVLCLLAVRLEVRGKVALEHGQGALLFCNHRSWLDPLVLMATTRSNGLSKKEIFYIPIVGVYGWLTGAVFFDRTDRGKRDAARREVMQLVRAGHRMQVFPEGTRSQDGQLAERVYLTMAYDAWRADVTVIPCAIWGSERVLPRSEAAAWPFQGVVLEIGEALAPADFDDVRTFADACWAQVVAGVSRARGADDARSGDRTRTP